MNHTPEPWRIESGTTAGSPLEIVVDTLVGGEHCTLQVALVCDGSLYTNDARRDANGVRVVAAVNAVAGIPTEELLRMGLGGLAKVYAAKGR